MRLLIGCVFILPFICSLVFFWPLLFPVHRLSDVVPPSAAQYTIDLVCKEEVRVFLRPTVTFCHEDTTYEDYALWRLVLIEEETRALAHYCLVSLLMTLFVWMVALVALLIYFADQ
jgi:hypothetical protein